MFSRLLFHYAEAQKEDRSVVQDRAGYNLTRHPGTMSRQPWISSAYTALFGLPCLLSPKFANVIDKYRNVYAMLSRQFS